MNMALVGGVALAAVAVGAVAYAAMQNKPASPVPAAVPAGTPATTLNPGTTYGLAALLPSGVTDQSTLTTQLQQAGWTNVNILYFQGQIGQNQLPAGLTSPGTGGYAATATWNGAANTPIPTGAVVVTT